MRGPGFPCASIEKVYPGTIFSGARARSVAPPGKSGKGNRGEKTAAVKVASWGLYRSWNPDPLACQPAALGGCRGAIPRCGQQGHGPAQKKFGKFLGWAADIF